MIKIVFIINNLCIGGIQKAFVNLMKELANNYDITLVVFSNHGGLKKALPVNIKLITLNDKLEVLGLSQKEVMKKGIRSITNHINIIYKIINDALKDIIIKITIIRTYEANVITSC